MNRICSVVGPWSALIGALLGWVALADTTYQKPPEAVLKALHTPPPPGAFVSPTHDAFILATAVRYPPIAWLAEPVLKLAGTRINPKTHGPHGVSYWSAFTLTRVADGTQQKVALPAGAKVTSPLWSADGKQFAFERYGPDSVELWVGDAATATVRRIPNVRLNPVLGYELQWLPDQKNLLAKLAVKGKGGPPPEPLAPSGPAIQETSGASSASSTYEKRDVLRGPHDVELFEYYGTSQLAIIDVATGVVGPYGKPGLYTVVLSSPDNKNLLVQSLHKPFSYLTTYERFPTDVEVWSTGGKVKKVATLPLFDHVPIQGVHEGPRDFSWRPTEPATLLWAEALDGGDWKTKVPARDRVMALRAPFEAPAVELFKTTMRFTGFWWPEKGPVFASEYDLIKRSLRTSLVSVDDPAIAARVVWERSLDERYKNPGDPLFKTLPSGFVVVQQQGDAIFLRGAGASPEGDRPFLDRFDVNTLKAERLFRSDKTSYDLPLEWVDLKAGQLLVRHESPTEPPNFFVRTLGEPIAAAPDGEPVRGWTSRQITRMTDPLPELRGITKQIVRYKRADGLDLSFTLYLPPGAKPGEKLPTVVWAYPLDFADPQAAGQVVGSAQRFTVLGWPLQLFFLLDGYAVIDNPSLPVVGDSMKIYDTYMEQLIAGATAAVNKAVELGVTDPERIGVMGHSHGGLMTANLLTHSTLFRAGIARSGAYNRSLTSFGFQSERRTLWEAPEVYLKVSPLFSADKLKLPILLIHGANDANPGTEPVQSEKLYEAIRGNGGTARLVMLPLESHGYAAMESNEHVLAESLEWFDRFVKHAPPRPAPKAEPTKAKPLDAGR